MAKFHFGMLCLMESLYCFLLAGPAMRTWMECRFPETADSIQSRFGFHRLRCRIRFARVLARLLDAGVAEDDALIVSAKVSGNSRIKRKIAAAVAEVRAGAGLLAALEKVELDEDFYFRINAARSSGQSLVEALEDWMESTRARAEYRERVTVNLLSTSFIIYNAALIGTFGYCVFHIEWQLINMTMMW